MIHKSLIIFVSLIMAVCVLTSPIKAQEKTSQSDVTPPTTPLPLPSTPPESGIDLTVSPVFINLVTDPGKAVSTQVKIKNNSNISEYLRVRVARFEASADGSQPKLVDIDPKDEFLTWISFSESEFQLEPNQTKTIKVQIKPSQSAGLGYYYGLVFQRIQEQDTGATGTTISGAPAISLLLEVRSSRAKRELQILDFSTDKLVYEYLPVEFDVTVKNTGNIHVVPAGDVFLDSTRYKDIAALRLNESLGNVLPQSQRSFHVRWDDGMIVRKPIQKDGKEEGFRTHWDLSKADKFRVGKYTAHILMVYDNGERDVPIEAEVSFWVFPWKVLGIAALVAIFTLYGLRSMMLSAKRKLRARST
jgi:hypothetical protein